MNTIRPLHFALLSLALMAAPTPAAVLFNNDFPTNQIGMASRPSSLGKIEIEAADDFAFDTATQLTGATFTGLIPLNAGNVSKVRVEIYRVFPLDSNDPPSGAVPTRVNSPSDVAFSERESGLDLSVGAQLGLSNNLALNSVVNNINPATIPTGGEGQVVGQQIQFTTQFAPINLPAGHYFFVPQIQLENGDFLWLSGPRPALSPFPAGVNDLQAWIRNENLAPDWMRVGTDIVGGGATFNGAFSLIGTVVPEAQTWAMLAVGLAGLGMWGGRRRR